MVHHLIASQGTATVCLESSSHMGMFCRSAPRCCASHHVNSKYVWRTRASLYSCCCFILSLPLLQALLVALLKFLEPHLRSADLTDAVRSLYRGALRLLLVSHMTCMRSASKRS
jgi:hypothetical protein